MTPLKFRAWDNRTKTMRKVVAVYFHPEGHITHVDLFRELPAGADPDESRIEKADLKQVTLVQVRDGDCDTLSDRIQDEWDGRCLPVEDVERFIRWLKQDFEDNYGEAESARMKGIITERAGDTIAWGGKA